MFDYSAKTGVHIVTALPSHLHKSKHIVHLLSKNMTFTLAVNMIDIYHYICITCELHLHHHKFYILHVHILMCI